MSLGNQVLCERIFMMNHSPNFIHRKSKVYAYTLYLTIWNLEVKAKYVYF